MPITEAEWAATQKTKHAKEQSQRTINTDFLRQAAVQSQYLTGQPAWDHYLQKLQVMLDETDKELTNIHNTLATPITEEQLRLAYVAVNVLTERARVLKTCLSLPKEIIDHAAEHGLITR